MGITFRKVQSMVKKKMKQHISLGGLKYIFDHYRQSGQVKRCPGSGRKRVTTKGEDRLVKQILLSDRKQTAHTISRRFQEQTRKKISHNTVRRRLFEFGFKSFKCAKKPALSKKNLADRKTWYKEYKNWPISEWNRVVFSDESRFQLVSDQQERCYRRRGERFLPACVQATRKHGGGVGISVWGCFSSKGVGVLRRLDRNVNAVYYKEILTDSIIPSMYTFFPDGNITFQQDNAPAHTAKLIKHQNLILARSIP
jgi:hypothetical protein